MKRSMIILCWVFIAACGEKTKLSKEDLQWVDYQPEEKLIFKSNKGNNDTIVITERRIYYPDYNPIELHDKYHPQMASVKAKRRGMDAFSFVELQKRKPDKPANWGVTIKFPGFFDNNSDTIKVVSSKLNFEQGNIYKLPQSKNDIEAFNFNRTLFVAHIYLTLDYSILAYEMSDGELYERVELK